MAESVSHRLNEYLRNGQPNEEMNQSVPAFESNQDGMQLGKDWDSQRYRDRRSSITSFADLYERAVRNLLNIRPLFDSPLDIFGAKGADANSHTHSLSNHAQTRHYGSDRTNQKESNNENSEKQSRGISDTTFGQSDYLSRENGYSTNGFFAQFLTEHARQNRQNSPYITNRHGFPGNHNERTIQTNGRFVSSDPIRNGHEQANQHRSETNRSRNEGGQIGDQKSYWRHNSDQSHRHRPSMFDDLRYHARLVLSAEVNAQKEGKNQSYASSKEAKNDVILKVGDFVDNKTEVNSMENEASKLKDTKLNEKEQLDLIRERIIKENQKLKYRPYSLRSKRNHLKSGKKHSKKKKLKKKPSLKNLWKPSTPKEIFLAQFGLMRKITNSAKQIQENSSGKT